MLVYLFNHYLDSIVGICGILQTQRYMVASLRNFHSYWDRHIETTSQLSTGEDRGEGEGNKRVLNGG